MRVVGDAGDTTGCVDAAESDDERVVADGFVALPQADRSLDGVDAGDGVVDESMAQPGQRMFEWELQQLR